MREHLIIWSLFIILYSIEGTIKNEKGPYHGPTVKSVYEKDLVTEFPSASQILKHHASYFKDTSLANFNGTVLGYVTPWNNHGYDVAQVFANKFTHISPVWLQLRPKGPKTYEFTGTHDIDQGWIKRVKKAGSKRKVKIVPRVIFDQWTVIAMNRLMSSADEQEILSETIVQFCLDHKFDGFVLEVWSQFGRNSHLWTLTQLVKQIGDGMKKNDLDFILVIPPLRGEDVELFDETHFDNLYDHVTAFSLMTYDFSTIERPGPNSPIDWVRSCVESLSMDSVRRKKILAGLNFYGYDYTSRGGGPIVAHEFLKLLKSFKGKMSFSREYQEHHFEVKNDEGRHWVFYPTLLSIKARIDLIQELDAGLSIWELGQGLDYFYDLL